MTDNIWEWSRREWRADLAHLFVERPHDLDVAEAWWQGSERLFSLTGEPATGKSWLMKKLEEKWAEEAAVIWIDLRHLLVQPDDQNGQQGDLDPTQQEKWIANWVDKLTQEGCSNVANDPVISISVRVNNTGRALVDHCSDSKPVIFFIDEGDRCSEQGWFQVGERILEPLAAIQPLRFVIALRPDQKSVYALQESESRHHLTPFPNGREQIEKLVDDYSKSPDARPVSAETVINALSGYNWSHPGLNAFFCWYYLNYKPSEINGYDVLVTAIRSLRDPRWEAISEAEASQVVDLLWLLAPLGEFTHADLVQKKNVSQRDAWGDIKLLQKYGLANNNIAGGLRFYIILGVREFVLACIKKGGLPG